MRELSGVVHETPLIPQNPGQEVIRFRVGDYVLYNGVIGLVTGIGKRLPTGGDTRLKTLEVRVDSETMQYGLAHMDKVKRLDAAGAMLSACACGTQTGRR